MKKINFFRDIVEGNLLWNWCWNQNTTYHGLLMKVTSEIIFQFLSTLLQIPQATNKLLANRVWWKQARASCHRTPFNSIHCPHSLSHRRMWSHSAKSEGTLHGGAAAPTLIVASGVAHWKSHTCPHWNICLQKVLHMPALKVSTQYSLKVLG